MQTLLISSATAIKVVAIILPLKIITKPEILYKPAMEDRNIPIKTIKYRNKLLIIYIYILKTTYLFKNKLFFKNYCAGGVTVFNILLL